MFDVKVDGSEREWRAYCTVNQKFCDKARSCRDRSELPPRSCRDPAEISPTFCRLYRLGSRRAAQVMEVYEPGHLLWGRGLSTI